MPPMTKALHKKFKRTEVWLDAGDIKAVETLRRRYGVLMATSGINTISTAAVIRRAIRLLNDETRAVNMVRPGQKLAEISVMAEIVNNRQ